MPFTEEKEKLPLLDARPARSGTSPFIFWLLTLVLITGGIVRSNWATRLDGFTLDEAYHIMAGASYVQTGSFRINPEHPPLTKLVVGAEVLRNGYKLSPFRPLTDKHDERKFAEQDVYLKNDPVLVQKQARMAMFVLNGLLLLLLTVLARRVLGATVALWTLVYLVVDPTVAAHLPVVMTDLPIALASGAAMLAAVVAFRSWKLTDLLITAGCLGLALGAKHSAIITVVGVGLLGCILAFVGPIKRTSSNGRPVWIDRVRRLVSVAGVLLGAVVVLWGFYGFRYSDSPTAGEFFNRPLATKVDDIQSPLPKALLHTLADAHVLPASYLWGLADTFRAGVEGRAASIFAFGRVYFNRAPVYYAPGIWAVKLPIGLLLLSLSGLLLLLMRKVPASTRWPLASLGLLAGLFWLALATGSTYGGVRHALALLPVLAVLGALAVVMVWKSGSLWGRAGVAVAGAVALITALPVVRPWEYFNELAGGSANSYRYFSDEGVDLSQRSIELVKYYKKNLEPTGELPFIWYGFSRSEKQHYNLHWVGEKPEQDSARYQSVYVSGTFFLSTVRLAPNLYDKDDEMAVFRKARPVARMGNLLVYRGRFYLPNERAYWLGGQGFKALYVDAKPDTSKAIRFIQAAITLYPKNFAADWELGNLYASRNARQPAIYAFTLARTYCPDEAMKNLLTTHINRLKTGDLRRIPPLRNPNLE